MCEVKFKCMCINDCADFGMERGIDYNGVVRIDEDSSATFAVELPDGGTLMCVLEWFANYFKIIE
jgi:hypothetical protein